MTPVRALAEEGLGAQGAQKAGISLQLRSAPPSPGSFWSRHEVEPTPSLHRTPGAAWGSRSWGWARGRIPGPWELPCGLC